MARPKGNEGDAKARLVEAAGRGFRTGGFGGTGVDALAKGAGLTSGAFYAHFDSKAEAFRLVVSDGIATLRNGIAAPGAIRLSISISANAWTLRCRTPAGCPVSRRMSHAPMMRRVRCTR